MIRLYADGKATTTMYAICTCSDFQPTGEQTKCRALYHTSGRKLAPVEVPNRKQKRAKAAKTRAFLKAIQ